MALKLRLKFLYELLPFTSLTDWFCIPEVESVYSAVRTESLYRAILSLEVPNKFGKSIPEFGETHSSVLGCERRPVSASIMSRSCFTLFFHFQVIIPIT